MTSKKWGLLLACIGIFNFASIAQSKLENAFGNAQDKMNAKKSAKSSSAGQKDLESTVLDDKEILKDSRGMSGIYYAKTPFQGFAPNNKKYTVQKLLVNYRETPDNKKNKIEISTQYAFETNKTRIISPMIFSPDLTDVKLGERTGALYIREGDYTNQRYQYQTYSSSEKDFSGKPKAYYTGFHSKSFVEIEPGILLIGDLTVYSKDGEKEINEYKQTKEVVVLYRKEKAAEAEKYTREYCWDKLVAFWKKYNAASDDLDGEKVEMPAPLTNAKEAPSNADIVKAVEARITKFQWNETVDYVYIISEWKNEYKPMGALGQNTLVARIMGVQAITKKDGKCRVTFMNIKQDNTFTTGSVEPNFGTNPVYVLGNGPTTTTDCAKAQMYKK